MDCCTKNACASPSLPRTPSFWLFKQECKRVISVAAMASELAIVLMVAGCRYCIYRAKNWWEADTIERHNPLLIIDVFFLVLWSSSERRKFSAAGAN
jgi:hypothetical protein